MSDLPTPGELVHLDCRRTTRHAASQRPLKLLQWNIERGYKLSEIVKELEQIDADVIALQEVDIGCERSDSVDTGKHIAEALGLNYIFFCEFEELHSSLRSKEVQGGGVHGNALLSKFDMSDAYLVRHKMHPVDWNDPTHPLAQSEPRRGERAVLAATVHTPHGPLLCYCLHMEVFCGMLARIEQFADVLADSKKQIRKGMQHQAIFGDLNTMAHGIARFSPKFCTDKMRFWSLGQSEAVFWDYNVFQVMDPLTSPTQLGAVEAAASSSQHEDISKHDANLNKRLQWWGLFEQVCRDITNPGFEDPFDAASTVTLDNPAYRYFGISLMKGKLDWLMLRSMQVQDKSIGNDDYAASDHKWLLVSVSFV